MRISIALDLHEEIEGTKEWKGGRGEDRKEVFLNAVIIHGSVRMMKAVDSYSSKQCHKH